MEDNALVGHPDIAHVTFTGSVATGQGVMSGFGREKELPALSSYYRVKCITTRL